MKLKFNKSRIVSITALSAGVVAAIVCSVRFNLTEQIHFPKALNASVLEKLNNVESGTKEHGSTTVKDQSRSINAGTAPMQFTQPESLAETDVGSAMSVVPVSRKSGAYMSQPATIPTAGQQQRDISALEQNSVDGALQVTWTPETGKPRFVIGRIKTNLQAGLVQANPGKAAIQLLDQFGKPFGVNDAVHTAELTNAYTDEIGRDHITMQQKSNGIDVLGAELRLHLDGEEITAINGTFAEQFDLSDYSPATTAADAIRIAGELHHNSSIKWKPELYVLSREIDESLESDYLAWSVETYNDNDSSAYLFLLDAHTGNLIRKVDMVHSSINRILYDYAGTKSRPSTAYSTEGSPPPASDPDGHSAYFDAGTVYNHFNTQHGWTSHDDMDSPIDIGIRYEGYGNAFWKNDSIRFNDGMVTLDIMGHEFTHGVINGMGGKLLYWGQSGALNESFADIFGAIIDSSNFSIGEGSTVGAFRNIQNPANHGGYDGGGFFNYPAHVSDYRCYFLFDNAGVHINSNIHNHAGYNLMTFSGNVVAGKIFFRALHNYLGLTSNFADARDAAIAAATDLYGAGSSHRANVIAAYTDIGMPQNAGAPRCGFSSTCSFELIPPPPPDDPGPNGGGGGGGGPGNGGWDDNCGPGTNRHCPVQAQLNAGYSIRDDLFAQTVYGQHLIDKYYAHTSRVNSLILNNSALFADATALIGDAVAGAISAADADSENNDILTAAFLNDVQAFINGLTTADAGGQLTADLQSTTGWINWNSLTGMTWEQALNHLTTIYEGM